MPDDIRQQLAATVVSDRIWFDGFECFRVGDVREFRPDPYAVFAESALKKRGERVPKKPRVSVVTSRNCCFPQAGSSRS